MSVIISKEPFETDKHTTGALVSGGKGMKGSMCRLYDESLVRNIMVSTGLSILEYLKKHPNAEADDICDFVETHADTIIETTIRDINQYDENTEDNDWTDEDAPPP
jgi:hypothetical protein